MFHLLFAWRYFRAKKSTQAINIIAWISMVAIALITAAFIVLLSVFNGFEGLVKSLYSSFYPDLRITPLNGKVFTIPDPVFDKIRDMQGVAFSSGVVEERALLQNGDFQTIISLKGVDTHYRQVTGVFGKIDRGGYAIGDVEHPGLVMGGAIASIIGSDVEKDIYPLSIYLFRRGVALNTLDASQYFSSATIRATGTFFIQQDIDSKYAITNGAFMRQMLGLRSDEYSSLEVRLAHADATDRVQQQLQTLLGKDFLIENRYQQNKSLYSVMVTEKWAVYGILCLMLVVAAFTMIGSLTMLVMEKQKDIQVLKAMGASNGRIRGIFLAEGFLLGCLGGFSGLLLGVAICMGQVTFKWVGIQGGTFLIDYYPVAMDPADFLVVGATVILVALIASWVPARKAAIQPIELRT
ncbi:MAG: hypothetical protein RL732_1560 [Bacteroidota bacterium]